MVHKDPKVEKWLKKKKAKSHHWQVKTLLNNLRLKYKEKFKGKSNYCIEVPLFGIRFRFNEFEQPEDKDWKVFLIDEYKLQENSDYFYDDVMWYLIEKGYFYYIQESNLGINGAVGKHILIDAGWARKIIEKRIELCGDKPENRFMKARMEELLSFPVHKILSSYTMGFFGYLF